MGAGASASASERYSLLIQQEDEDLIAALAQFYATQPERAKNVFDAALKAGQSGGFDIKALSTNHAHVEGQNIVSDPNSLRDKISQETFEEMNVIRTNPKSYIPRLQQMLPKFDNLDFNDEAHGRILETLEGAAAVQELIKYLETVEPVPALVGVSEPLILAAEEHAKDTGANGIFGHFGSDNSNPEERISRHGIWQDEMGENISYGCTTGVENILQLMIDDGVKDRGHRTTLMKPAFNVCGIACASHSAKKHTCVITYAGGMSPLGAEGETKEDEVVPAAPAASGSTAAAAQGIVAEGSEGVTPPFQEIIDALAAVGHTQIVEEVKKALGEGKKVSLDYKPAPGGTIAASIFTPEGTMIINGEF